MARVSSARDTFLPRIESAFYATFHEDKGPQIVFQVPEGLITQGSSNSTASTLQSSRNTNLSPPVRGLNDASSLPAGLVTSPTTLTPSSSSINISTNDEIKTDSSMYSHRASSSTSTVDTSSPSSPASYRSNQQHRRLKPSSSSSSPQKPSSPQPAPTPGSFLKFSDISRFVIPTQDMCGRLVICSTQTHRVMGFPVCLEAAKYKRVHFRYNLCFVFERTADLSCYEPVVRKIARVLMACEEESSFLSDPNTAHQIYPILEQLYEDLNNYHETSIPIVDQFNSIELKLFPFYPNPPDVYDWTVPLALINLMKRMEPNWDLTMIKVCKYIDGINHVSRIANLADCDLELTRQAISHLLYYQCIMTLDIFQYSNIYTLDKALRWLADDPNIKEECGPYVTRPGMRDNIPDWPNLLFLYSRLKPGKTVLAWEEEHGVREQGIDVRRFMSFGVIKGFLRRIHRWPILMPQKPPGAPIERPDVTVDTKMSIGRKRGKSLSHTTKERPRSPEMQRERSHSQSQSEYPTHLQSRPLTEAEEYARSIQLRVESISNENNNATLRARKGSSNRDIMDSRRLSWQERPAIRRQSSGPATPRPLPANLPAIDAYRQHFRPTNYTASPSPDKYPNFGAPAYPPELSALLDGTHHTDELATRFEAGWPTLEKWLVALGGGEGSGDFGRVAIIYR